MSERRVKRTNSFFRWCSKARRNKAKPC